jgi:hypothetical protein
MAEALGFAFFTTGFFLGFEAAAALGLRGSSIAVPFGFGFFAAGLFGSLAFEEFALRAVRFLFFISS